MATDSILVNATDEQLGLAVQTNLFDLFRAMMALPNSQIEETSTLSRHLASPTNPMYKGAWGTNLAPNEVDTAIHETIDWFKSRDAPFFFWWTGPGTTPEKIGERLIAHGLIDMEGQSKEMASNIISTASGAPGMTADLFKMNETVLDKAPQELEINEVQNENDLQGFKQVLIEGYDIPAPMADGWVQAAHEFGVGKTPWRMVLARLNGEPAGTNIVFTGTGVVGVYGITVSPSARGKGIGAAITLKPILEERDNHGYKYAVLFSTEMGAPVYERIGFRMTDVRINRYLWRNA
ncbi:MAG: GNAT family N-acetyltransferase [Anaerolineales bacterium]|nr:GNAT family N-acetyltransferase [Anaerolineales bacterium]